MADPTGPMPPQFGGDDTPFGKCAVGLRNVTLYFSDCASGSGLVTWNLHLGWNSDFAKLVATGNGSDYVTVYCVLPGVKYRVTCAGYDDVDFELTSQDVSSRTRAVCLNRKPSPPQKKPRCYIASAALSAAFGEVDGPMDKALDSLRTFRDAIDGDGIGGMAINAYYDDSTFSALNKAIESDRELALATVAVVLELQPLLFDLTIQRRWASLRMAEPLPPFMNRSSLARLSPETAGRIGHLANRFAEKSGEQLALPLKLLGRIVQRCVNLDVFDIVAQMRSSA